MSEERNAMVPVANTALKPHDYLEMAQAAQAVGESYAVLANLPKSAGPAVMMVCMQEGMSPVDFVRTYHMIQGKPTMRADAMLAKFNQMGWRHEVAESTPQIAKIKIWRNDEPATSAQTWELDRKQVEGSRWPWADWRDHSKGYKDNWATDEDWENMLWCRLVSKMIRKVEPSVVSGMYTPQEMSDVIDVEFKVQPRLPGSDKSVVELAASAGGGDTSKPEPPALSEEADDADYEVVPSQPAQQLEEAAVPMEGQGGFKKCSPQQISRIANLWAELDFGDADQQAQLAKRNCKILADLTEMQATEMIERLELFKASQAKN